MAVCTQLVELCFTAPIVSFGKKKKKMLMLISTTYVHAILAKRSIGFYTDYLVPTQSISLFGLSGKMLLFEVFVKTLATTEVHTFQLCMDDVEIHCHPSSPFSCRESIFSRCSQFRVFIAHCDKNICLFGRFLFPVTCCLFEFFFATF